MVWSLPRSRMRAGSARISSRAATTTVIRGSGARGAADGVEDVAGRARRVPACTRATVASPMAADATPTRRTGIRPIRAPSAPPRARSASATARQAAGVRSGARPGSRIAADASGAQSARFVAIGAPCFAIVHDRLQAEGDRAPPLPAPVAPRRRVDPRTTHRLPVVSSRRDIGWARRDGTWREQRRDER